MIRNINFPENATSVDDFSMELFSQVDQALAKYLLDNGTREQFLALCYLSMCSRSGNICVNIDSIEDENIKNGLKSLPGFLFCENDIIKPLVKNENNIYLQRNWYYETLFLEHYERIVSIKPSKTFEIAPHKKLLSEQYKAIKRATQNTMTIITGGPGTGKTYTISCLIEMLLKEKNITLAVAAPTGKAVAHLQKYVSTEVKTVHSLLGVRSGDTKPRHIINADIVIIDECSMVDVKMMAFLFASLKKGAQIILVGDEYQLPPVETGSIFADLVRCSGQHDVVALQKCLRTELASIIELADCIRRGDSKAALHMLYKEQHSEISIKDLNKRDLIQKILHENKTLFSPEDFFENSSCILSPIRRGVYGVDSLNKDIVKKVIQHSNNEYLMIPVMISQNDYTLELYNGEIGVLVCKKAANLANKKFQVGDYAVFKGHTKKYPALLLPKIEFAYCLSVHKSQGSEFSKVALILPDGAEIFGRGMLYTAVTRTKKKLDIYGSREIIEKIMYKSDKRFSGIETRLSSYERVWH